MPTTIIGLDGADWQIINPLLKSGQLPVLKRLMDGGCHGILHSTTPPNSPPAWASMITGVNPGKHNVFDFTYIDENYYKVPVDAMSRIALPPIWRIMNHRELSVGMVNLPIQYPPETVNGFMVCGMITPWNTETFTYPQELSQKIGKPGDNWIIGQTLVRGGSPEEFLAEIKQKTRTQSEWIIRLQNEYKPEFLMAVFDGTDKLQHFFWKYWDQHHPRHDPQAGAVLKQSIPEYYREVDALLGGIIEARGESDLFIVSDHGFTGMANDVFIEKWLLQNNYLNLKSPPTLPKKINGRTRVPAWNILAQNDNLKTFLKKNKLTNWLIQKFKSWDARKNNSTQLNRNTDWSSTRVFFTGTSSQALQVNLKGREMLGIVEPAEYETLMRGVIAELLSITDPENGKPVIKSAYRKDDLYHGPWTQNSPDITIITNDGYALQEGFPNKLVSPSALFSMDRSGGHRDEGIFIACGPNIRKHELTLEAQITDIMPTILCLNKIPIPTYVDGVALTDLIQEAFLEKNPLTVTGDFTLSHSHEEEMTPEEKVLLENHLRALGYF
ncbi:MAG: alkaline phosphatase family protein [Chloroflexi bacterium]|nr:alkaline phosphatase family protein [Chloroflexota bacterium]